MLAFSSYSPVFVVVFNFILFVLSHDRNKYSLLVTSAADIGLQTKHLTSIAAHPAFRMTKCFVLCFTFPFPLFLSYNII